MITNPDNDQRQLVVCKDTGEISASYPNEERT